MLKPSRRKLLATMAAGAAVFKAQGFAALASNDGPSGLGGRLITPDDPGYDQARLPWCRYLVDRPRAIVFAEEPDDVVDGVSWARATDVPLRARSGRHALAPGISSVEGGLVIDVSRFKDVVFDQDAGTATVGAGLTQLEVVEKLGENGLALTTGAEASVGIAGVTLGGGIGYLARSLGPTCDSLVGLDIVVADGADGARLIRVDQDNHPDLLWACRGGGGGNFGIVTSFTFRPHPVRDVTHFKVNWDWSDPLTAFHTWQDWAPTADRRFGSTFVFLPRDSDVLEVEGLFIGQEDEARAKLAPILAVGDPKVTMKTSALPVYYKEVNAGPRHFDNWRFSSSWIREPLPPSAVETILHFMSETPTPACNYWCLTWGEATKEEPPGGAAFFHRDALYYAEPGAAWNDPTKIEAAIRWTDAFADAMRPYVTGAYINVPDPGFENPGALYYGEHYQRLREIKRRYDPHNIFQYPQSIEPAA